MGRALQFTFWLLASHPRGAWILAEVKARSLEIKGTIPLDEFALIAQRVVRAGVPAA